MKKLTFQEVSLLPVGTRVSTPTVGGDEFEITLNQKNEKVLTLVPNVPLNVFSPGDVIEFSILTSTNPILTRVKLFSL
jgi:hypothetical protein